MATDLPDRPLVHVGVSWPGFAKPQREIRGLHSLLDHCQQILIQLLQVHLLAKGVAEARHHPGRIVLAAIEPAAHMIQPGRAVSRTLCGSILSEEVSQNRYELYDGRTVAKSPTLPGAESAGGSVNQKRAPLQGILSTPT
jgi:hypothetical protein